MGCGADTNANALLTALIAGKDFTLPDVDLTDPDFEFPDTGAIVPPTALTNALLTEKIVTGNGTFDVIMQAINNQLKEQFEKSRITGAEYAKVYMESLGHALSGAIQFLTTKDVAYYQALTAQYQAKIAEAELVKSRVELETAKAQLAVARLEAANQEATYALTKMKLSTEDVAYCIAQYNLDHILPAQKILLTEQGEAQRAQTLDTRSDGITPVTGLLGKQKDLYTQQITSYQRDAEVKAAKLFTDAWITMKTIDEGLLPPTNFDNTSLNNILADLKTNNSLG